MVTVCIPEPGHPYWTETSLALASARFGPDFDPAPYLAVGNVGPACPPPTLTPVPAAAPRQTPGGLGWLFPDTVAGVGGAVLSDEQVAQFQNEGFLLIDGIWPEDVMAEAIDAVDEMYPPGVQLGEQPGSSGK